MINKFDDFYQGIGNSIDPENIGSFTNKLKGRKLLSEEKFDGIWCAVVFDESGKVSLMSRTGKDKENEQLKSLRVYLEDTFKLRNSVLAGELAFGTQTGTEYAKKYGHHKIDLFDVLHFENLSMYDYNLLTRKKRLSKILENSNIKNNQWVSEASYRILSNITDISNMFLDIVNRGGEGIVLKDIDDETYRLGGRSPYWYRIKKLVDMDYIIMGYTDTNSSIYKEKGYIGGIEGGLIENNIIVKKVTIGSMSDWWRKEFYDNGYKYIGRVMECKGREIFKSGSLRHPFFSCIRDDKNSIDCRWPIEYGLLK